MGAFAYNLRFPGQYFDAETGKHYNYFRDYDPRLGRYVQSDPIGLQGGLNTFGYVRGRPLNLFDPLGLVYYTGLEVIREHLEDLARRQGDNFSTSYHLAPEREMFNRLMQGKDSPADLGFYHHERSEADQCRAFRSLPNDQYLDLQQEVHDRVEREQQNTWADRYHPDVVRRFPDLFRR